MHTPSNERVRQRSVRPTTQPCCNPTGNQLPDRTEQRRLQSMDLRPNNKEPIRNNSGAAGKARVDAKAMRVVVFDDEAEVTDAIKVMIHFRWPEVEVVTCNHAEEALRELERRPPDLFTTDIHHPGMLPTMEIIQRLAKQKVKYPIFVISALLEMFAPGEAKKCAEQGLKVELLTKPFLAEDLWQLIAKHLGLPMEPLPVPKDRPRPRLP